jgi:hypothetical protein
MQATMQEWRERAKSSAAHMLATEAPANPGQRKHICGILLTGRSACSAAHTGHSSGSMR